MWFARQSIPTCFQSRFGREPWLEPYTQQVLTDLAKEGVEEVDVVCPGFSVDCLETIDEVTYELDEIFKEEGGKKLNYIPALNDADEAIELYAYLIKKKIVS